MHMSAKADISSVPARMGGTAMRDNSVPAPMPTYVIATPHPNTNSGRGTAPCLDSPTSNTQNSRSKNS